MPWTNFKCPDGVLIRIEECLEKCRMEGRCVAKPTLIMFAKGRRPWTGKLSTTSALNGTRLEYLKIFHDYAEAPHSRAFALLGTFHHTRYQKLNLPNALHEESMEDEYSTGIFDYYDGDTGELFDFKTVGCWKICKWLGKHQIEEDTGEVYKSGPRKGQPKTVKRWTMGQPDNFDLRMQLSRYAHMLVDAGFPVNAIYVQATVRDFTKMTARMYGLSKPIYLLQVDPFPREEVVEFYRRKNEAINLAIARGEVPPVCTPEERWDDRRCLEYCPVWAWCDHGLRLQTTVREDEDGETA